MNIGASGLPVLPAVQALPAALLLFFRDMPTSLFFRAIPTAVFLRAMPAVLCRRAMPAAVLLRRALGCRWGTRI